MELSTLLFYEFKSLLKQRAIILTILIPMLFITFLAISPTLITQQAPITVVVYNQDIGINSSLKLGKFMTGQLQTNFNSSTVKFEEVNSFGKFSNSTNGIWFPQNFSTVAIKDHKLQYFFRESSSDIRVSSIFGKEIQPFIYQQFLKILNITDLPKIDVSVYKNSIEQLKQKEISIKGNLAFPLVYMIFLVLMMGSSFVRFVSFAKEKQSNMMELLLYSVKNRNNLIMSKLLIGTLFGVSIPLSYLFGLLFAGSVNQASGTSFSNPFVIQSSILYDPLVLTLLIILFLILSFMNMNFTLFFQLFFGRESGDRISGYLNIGLTFLFYISLLVDPLSTGIAQYVNPYFWPYRAVINIIFKENLLNTILYILAILLFNLLLLRGSVKAMSREKVLFE